MEKIKLKVNDKRGKDVKFLIQIELITAQKQSVFPEDTTEVAFEIGDYKLVKQYE